MREWRLRAQSPGKGDHEDLMRQTRRPNVSKPPKVKARRLVNVTALINKLMIFSSRTIRRNQLPHQMIVS